ncbi:MAG TPA: hypothetical protein VEC39_12255 [Vicinamibacterales bacterium]|nr:hypothetical protein [Vicinamibacterales bacterium]
MDITLLAITVVSLIVALVMSVTAWRLARAEKKRSAARVAALSLAAADDRTASDHAFPSREAFVAATRPVKAPWSAPRTAAELPLNQPTAETVHAAVAPSFTHATGFLGASELPRDNGGRQKSLGFAAAVLLLVLSGGLLWMMSGSRDTNAVAASSTAPLELVSLNHERQDQKLAISGLVRNPASGTAVEQLSAVVFLFDRAGTFVTSARANVDFLKLGAGDESPFVVSLEAPATVARYRVSFRTDEGVVPHVDRREKN